MPGHPRVGPGEGGARAEPTLSIVDLLLTLLPAHHEPIPGPAHQLSAAGWGGGGRLHLVSSQGNYKVD